MSDNLQSQEYKKNKLQEIMQSETRVAVNMDKTRNIDNAAYYSMEKTIEDTDFISRLLRESETEIFKLTDDEKIHLRNINNRNKSHIFLNQQKFSGDSGLMKTVKDSVEDLEKNLQAQANGLTLNDMEEKYRTAILACTNYCNNKNPWFKKGKERKKMVEERLNTLVNELAMYQRIKGELDFNKLDANVKCIDILELGYAWEVRKNAPLEPDAEEKIEEQNEEKIEEQNVEKNEEKIEEQNVEKNEEKVEEKNVETEKIEEQNIEEQNVETKKNEEQNIEEQNVNKQEEKEIVEEKNEENIEKNIEENVEDSIEERVKKKLDIFTEPTKEEKESAQKAIKDLRNNLKKYVQSPEDRIKKRVIENGKELIEWLDIFHNSDIGYYFDVNKEWKAMYNRFSKFSDARSYDVIYRIVERVRKNPKYDEDKRTATTIINMMDDLYSEAAKNCPLKSQSELDTILDKLSGSLVEQKQAITELENYMNAIREWDLSSRSEKNYQLNRSEMTSDISSIYYELREILLEHRKANPKIFVMSEEEVAFYQEKMDPIEREKREEEESRQKEEKERIEKENKEKEEKERKEKEYKQRDEAELKEMLQTVVKERRAKETEERKNKANIVKNEREEKEKVKQERKEKERIEKEKKQKEEREEKERLKKERIENEKRQKEEEARKERERIENEKKEKEEKERIENEKKQKEEEKRNAMSPVDRAIYNMSNLGLISEAELISNGEVIYKEMKDKIEKICQKSGVANGQKATELGFDSLLQKMLLPLMSEQGCTWDVLAAAMCLGQYSGQYYEEGYSRGLELIDAVCIQPLFESFEPGLYSYESYVPSYELLKGFKGKIKSDGKIVLPEETRYKIAAAFSMLNETDKDLMRGSSTDFTDFMDNMFMVYRADVYERFGRSIHSNSLGGDYISGGFCHSMMKDIVSSHRDLIR